MARAYSQDLRERVLGATAKGMSARQAAQRFGIGISTAIVWIRRARREGERSARRQGQPRRSKLDAHADFLLALVDAACDITLDEMQGCSATSRGAKCVGGHRNAMPVLRAPGLHVEKKRRTRPSRIARTSPPHVRPRLRPSPNSIQPGLCSSTRLAPAPRWPACAGVPLRVSG